MTTATRPLSLWPVIGLVFLAMSFIVTGDTAGKLLTGAGVAPFFVAWTRFAIAAVILLPLSGLRRAELRHLVDWRILLRALLICGGISFILTALKTEPIANVFGAFFIGPIISYVLSAVFLRETVTLRRSILLLIGFAGVLLVVKPGFGATPGLGFAMLAGVFYGGYLTTTRWLAPAFRPRLLLLSQMLAGAVFLAPLALLSQPEVLSGPQIGLIVLSAFASACGNFIVVSVSRNTAASLIAPLIYTQLIAATVAGFVVFGDLPGWVTVLGLIVIFLSGFGSLLASRRGR